MEIIGRAGGKSLGLVKLLSYGLCVPDFFVIPADADLNALGFRNELEEAAKKLGAGPFAVRSSGTQEDGAKKSFAGQYSTELNVSREELYSAVLKVAASANSETVKEYARQSEAKQSRRIAIIVQKQISPQKAGVMFTSSPFSKNEVLIEEVDGLGESLVSGEVTPRRKSFPKSKGIQASGYEEELLKAAVLLEKSEGKPMDIEWAYDGKLYFLQMRPITTVGDPLPDIAGKHWNLYVYRNFCRLCHSVQIKATEKAVQEKQFGVYMPVFEGILLNGREFYTEKNDRLSNQLWKEYDRNDFFGSFAGQIESLVKKTRQRANALQKKDVSSLGDRALFAAYDREIQYYIKSYLPLMMRPDEYLFEKLCKQIGQDRANALRGLLPSLAKKTMYAGEKKCFLQAVCQQTPGEYLRAFEWSNNPLSVFSAPIGEEEYWERAKDCTPEQAKKELQAICKRERISRKNAKKAVNAIQKEDAKKTIADIVKFIYLRTYTTENSDRYFFYIKERILSEISRRKNLPLKVLLGMDFCEISQLKNGGAVNLDEQQKRNRGELIVFSKEGAKTYYGANTYLLLQTIMPAETPRAGSVFPGQVACSGEAEGRVRIVRSFSDAKKMNDGEILVTSMTTPEISLAVDKAAGIITDEGGITCHAAIVAREWGIPCLIGTGKATSVLTDGMKVKLNCIKGFFEIQ